MELCAAPEENRHWTGPHTVLGVERPRGNLYTFNLQHLELVTEVYYLALTVEKISRDLPPPRQGWLSQEKDRLQRIQHTPVITHAFEKSVYNIHARGTVEQHLSSTQFAYTTRGGAV